MTLNSFFKEIQYPKPFLLDLRNFEIDFLLKAADEYNIDKTKLMYYIIEYRDKYRDRCKEKLFLKDKATGIIYKNRADFIKKNNLTDAIYKNEKDRFEYISINKLDEAGVDMDDYL